MRLLIDIDGTLRHVWPAINDWIYDRAGITLPEVWPNYGTANEIAGDDLANAAFEAVCGTYDQDDLWYPGAWDAMHDLRAAGIVPIFCTLNLVRHTTTIRKALERHYRNPVVVRRVKSSGNKLRVAREVEAVGIVDDKPGTIEAFNKAGYFTATMAHEYNAGVPTDYRFSVWNGGELADAVYTYIGQRPLFTESEAV